MSFNGCPFTGLTAASGYEHRKRMQQYHARYGGREGGREGGRRTLYLLLTNRLSFLLPSSSSPPLSLFSSSRAACALLHEVCPALEVGMEEEEEKGGRKGGGRVVATRVNAR